MAKNTLTILILIIILAFKSEDVVYRHIPQKCLVRGEKITYRLHYGMITAGEGVMEIDPKLYRVNDRVCYKMDISGKSTKMFDIFVRIRDKWGSYIDTAAIVPQKFYRFIEENKYRKNEVVSFDHANDTAIVSKLDKHTKELKKKVNFGIPNNSQDLVSSYYYLRTLDYDNINEGDTIHVETFFDDENFNFSIRFIGREKIKTKVGTFKSFMLAPIMPENGLFDGENSIKVWISDDQYKIPLKAKADMFIGAVEVDITDYENPKVN